MNRDARLAGGGSTGLRKGALGWTKVAALGIAIAVSGGFSGWNYGLAVGGWGGMFAASIAMAVLFFGLTQCLAELAAMMPRAAGFDAYVEGAFGRTAGYMAGMSVALGLAVGTGLGVSFAAGYCEGLFGIGGWPVKGGLLAVIFALQLRGANEAAGWTMGVGCAAIAILLLFCLSVIPYFSASHLLTSIDGGKPTLFYGGLAGAARCIPFALFLFLGVEQAAQAAAEMHNVAEEMPRALMAAIGVTCLFGVSIPLLATGSAGVAPLSSADDPLLAAVLAHPEAPLSAILSHIVGIGALGSLVATLFSLAYAASRQFYYLSHASYLPPWLATTNSRGAPAAALGLVAILGVIAANFRPEGVMVVFIFLLSVSHELIMLSFLRLRKTHFLTARPYKAIGGRVIVGIAAALSLMAMISCCKLQAAALTYTILGLAGLLLIHLFRRNSQRLGDGQP